MTAVQKVPTGCDALDALLNGGIEAGVITAVYGEAGSGKSNLCLQLVARKFEEGEDVLFIDTENSFSLERIQQLHEQPDLDRVALIEPTTFEEQRYAFRKLEELVAKREPALLAVDSLVALYRLALNDESATETNRELATQLATLARIARSEQIPVVVTAQVYDDFESGETRIVGRDTPTYWAKTLLKLEKSGRNQRKAILEKHRALPEGKEAIFQLTENGIVSAEEESARIF